MTKLERTIRQVSDLRDFYMKIKKEKGKNHIAKSSALVRGVSRDPGTSALQSR